MNMGRTLGGLVLTNEANQWIVDASRDFFDPTKLRKTRVNGEADLVQLVESDALFPEGDWLIFGSQMGLWAQTTTCFDTDNPKRLVFEVDEEIDTERVRAIYHQALMDASLKFAWWGQGEVQVEFRDTPAEATTTT